MDKRFSHSLVIFRRDLRLRDNTALMHACEDSHAVHAVFILDPRQIDESNQYRSLNALQFMRESLDDLRDQIAQHGGKLQILYGVPNEVLKDLLARNSLEAVYVNEDYTPFARERDVSLQELCKTADCAFFTYADSMLHRPGEVLKSDGKPYTVFTAYAKRASLSEVPVIQHIARYNFIDQSLKSAYTEIPVSFMAYTNKQLVVSGGMQHGQKIIKSLSKFKNYQKTRDFPSLSTTYLSAYLKFGCVSVREVYHAICEQLGSDHLLIKQLLWRDFFTQIVFYFPQVIGHSFHSEYDKLLWKNNRSDFERWCTGTTGFPIVDAGMRQLLATGWMHNRVRMIVASFLVKDLHIDWRWGEKFFAQHLVDYDPALNNGNWQWSASTGCDAQPYFRIFNPWLQQKKFDPACEYIKQWVPELSSLDAKAIHAWDKASQTTTLNYPEPMIDHAYAARIAKKMYEVR